MSNSGRNRVVLAVLAVLVSLAAAGCGPRGAAGVLDETASNMGDITSAHLRLRMVASAGAEGEGDPVGFELEGPFSLPTRKGMLPLARLSLTRLRGGKAEPTVFVSTGESAFVEVGGSAYQLPPEQVSSLQGGEPGTGGLEGLDVAEWALKPKVRDGGSVDGVAVQRVTAGVDVAEVLNDLIEVAGRVGAGPRPGCDGSRANPPTS